MVRPGHDEPEALPDSPAPGEGVRFRGGGTTEDLDEPGVWLVPAGRWVMPAFVVGTLCAAVAVLVLTILPWLRPVHLTAERANAVFQPGIQVDGRTWTEPGDLEPDRFVARFCNGLLAPILQPAERSLLVTGRGETPGNALAAVYPTADAADVAYADLASGLQNCRSRGGRWVAHETAAERAEGTTTFRLQSERAVRRDRHHLLLVRYANTMTLFMTPTTPDASATREAYAARVTAVARAE